MKIVSVLLLLGYIFFIGCQSQVISNNAEEIQNSSELSEPPENLNLSNVTEGVDTTTENVGESDRGDFVVIYEEVQSPNLKDREEEIKTSRMYEELANELNNAYILPYNITIILQECGVENAFWDSENASIEMCYELLDGIESTFEKQGHPPERVKQLAEETFQFVFYHELGHAFIYIYDLPLIGREEDAVDQFSAVVLVGENENVILAGAEFFYLDAKEFEEIDDSQFADEHGLGEQRYFNLLCLIYGTDPEYYRFLVEEEYWALPEERAEKCSYEYYKIANSWYRLLYPHFKEK